MLKPLEPRTARRTNSRLRLRTRQQQDHGHRRSPMVDRCQGGPTRGQRGPSARRARPGPTSGHRRPDARSGQPGRATLTPDDVAVSRSGAAVVRLDAMIEQMRRSGQLQEFNVRYKRGRAAAQAEGRGFMGYGVAMARLKAALIPMLQSGRPMRGVFDVTASLGTH
jgi:hypothetical protein